jgi:signal transduction histidine kinase
MDARGSEAAYWPARLAYLAALTGADALGLVLVRSDAQHVTYVHHNLLLTEGWEQSAGDGAVARAIAERATTRATADLWLADGRSARAMCVAPLMWGQSTIGALVGLRADSDWTADHERGLARAADLVALELAEANALWKAQRSLQEIEAKTETRELIQREIGGAADTDVILDRATRRLYELFGADGVSVMVIEPNGDLVVKSAVGSREEVVRNARRRLGEGISGWVAQHGQPLALSGPVEDSRFTGVDPTIGDALIAPLRSGDRIFGVINVRTHGGAERLGPTHLESLTSVGQEIGAALARAEATRQIEEDRRQALVLYELSRLATLGGDPKADLDMVVAMLADSLRHDVVSIWRAEASDSRLRLMAQRGYTDPVPEDISVEGDAIVQGAFIERRAQRMEEVAVRAAWLSRNARRYVLAPIVAGQQAVGLLIVGRRPDGAYADAEVDFTAIVAEYLGGLMQRAGGTDIADRTAAAERRRIAQELHDGLAQELTGVVLALEACQHALERDPDVLPSQLGRAARDARACLSDIRQYMTALRQQDGGTTTLPVTVSRLVDDLRRTSGMAIELEEIGSQRPISPQAERAIMRIAQEALHNVAAHARATHVKVLLDYADNGIVVTIEDDGQGFAADATLRGAEDRGRFGLVGMRERAEAVGGQLTVTSEPGRGTVVQAIMPYSTSSAQSDGLSPWPGKAPTPRPEAAVATKAADEDGPGGFLGKLFGRP